MKCEKLHFQKIVGNLLDKLRKLYMNRTAGPLEIFSRPQVIESSRQYLLLRTNILQKTVVGCPWSLFRVMLIKSQFLKKTCLVKPN